MSAKPFVVLLWLGVGSTALAIEEDVDALAPGAQNPASAEPKRHVITQQDHDAAVKAELAREHASTQSQAASAGAPTPPRDAPVAKTTVADPLLPASSAPAAKTAKPAKPGKRTVVASAKPKKKLVAKH